MSAEDQLRYLVSELRLIRKALERMSPPPPPKPSAYEPDERTGRGSAVVL